MKGILKSQERGHANHGWLDSKHTFSFAGYYDPNRMGFRSLRVINEDWIAGGGGFPPHPHQDMEIITYMVDGALRHQDTLGHTAVIRPGEVQRMSAGTGIRHSEFNESKTESAHLLQIWIMPSKKGIEPGYEQKDFSDVFAKNDLSLVVSGDGREGSMRIQQDADLWVGRKKTDGEVLFDLPAGRGLWLQCVKGDLKIDGEELKTGDAYVADEAGQFRFVVSAGTEFLIFDLAAA